MLKKRLKHCTPLLTLIIAALLLLPAHAEDSGTGRGVVTFSSDAFYSSTIAQELFPHTCIRDLCAMLQSLLYPRLFDVDPVTGTLLAADTSDRALVSVLPPTLPIGEVTLSLRQDRAWSDGAPITAYDVLFSLLAYTASPQNPYYPGLQEIVGARIVDDHTISLRYAATPAEIAKLAPGVPPPTPACDNLPRSNVYILPSHTLSPAFRAFVAQHTPQGESPSLAAWWKAYQDAKLPLPSAVPDDPVTSGAYAWAGVSSDGDARFVPADGTGAALARSVSLPSNSGRPPAIDAFIAGKSNLLLDVPIDQRAGLRSLGTPASRNFQIAEVPGRIALIVLLNFANPSRPLPGVHPETSQPLDQGKHPIFSDLKVRQALQLALDADKIIAGPLQNSALPLSGLLPPSSWAYDPSLPRLETNISAARRLLDAAGWIDNGVVRQCVHCQSAPHGTTLQFTLAIPNGYTEVADQLIQAWQQLDVNAILIDADVSALAGQTFDAYLLPLGGEPYEDADPDRKLLLTPAGDLLDYSSTVQAVNYGSYDNSQVTQLVDQARTLPGCSQTARAALYHQLDRLLQADLPFLSVAAPDEFYAAAPNVLGFAPRTGDPLWNVASWVVAS